MMLANFLLHLTGGDTGDSVYYLELSGFISILGYATFFTTWYRKHNCHQNRCWRIGKHSVGNSSLIVCQKHHPDHSGKKITPEHIQFHHLKHKRSILKP